MIDHIVGTPSPSWKRTQVSLLHVSSHPTPIFHPGFSRHLLLAMENYMGRRTRASNSLDTVFE